MAPYDSDSSGGEDNDYTETTVLLGYASKEALDDTISQIGGKPVRFISHPLLFHLPESLNIRALLTRFCRHGSTPLPHHHPPSQNVKYATTLWSFSSNSMAISQSSFPAMREDYTSLPVKGKHVGGKREV